MHLIYDYRLYLNIYNKENIHYVYTFSNGLILCPPYQVIGVGYPVNCFESVKPVCYNMNRKIECDRAKAERSYRMTYGEIKAQ